VTETDTDSELAAEGNRPLDIADEAELEAFTDEAPVALVEFYTNGCSLCQSMKPVVRNVTRELDIAAGFVNPRDDPPLVERFDVTRVPLFVLFVDGQPVARRDDGFVPGDELTEWIRAETA